MRIRLCIIGTFYFVFQENVYIFKTTCFSGLMFLILIPDNGALRQHILESCHKMHTPRS